MQNTNLTGASCPCLLTYCLQSSESSVHGHARFCLQSVITFPVQPRDALHFSHRQHSSWWSLQPGVFPTANRYQSSRQELLKHTEQARCSNNSMPSRASSPTHTWVFMKIFPPSTRSPEAYSSLPQPPYALCQNIVTLECPPARNHNPWRTKHNTKHLWGDCCCPAKITLILI